MKRANSVEYITTEELAARIKYDPRTIRSQLKDSVLIEGVHYIRPFGQRKILFLWQAIERDMVKHSLSACPVAPRENLQAVANG